METLGSTVRYLQEVPLSLLTRSETTWLYGGLLGLLVLWTFMVGGHCGVVKGVSRYPLYSVDQGNFKITWWLSSAFQWSSFVKLSQCPLSILQPAWDSKKSHFLTSAFFIRQSCHNRHCSHCWCKWHPFSFKLRSKISNKFPNHSENNLIQNQSWINDKKKIEGIEGLTCPRKNPRQTKPLAAKC